MGSARRRRGHRIDRVPAVGADERLSESRLEVFEVVEGQAPPESATGLGNRARHAAVCEHPWAAALYFFEGTGQVELLEPLSHRVGAPVLKKDPRRLRVGAERLELGRTRGVEGRSDEKPLSSKANGGGECLAQLQSPVPSLGFGEPRNHPRDRDRVDAVQ